MSVARFYRRSVISCCPYGHQPDHQIAGDPKRSAQLAQPGPVAVSVGHLERHALIERDGSGRSRLPTCIVRRPGRPTPRTASRPALPRDSARASRNALSDGVFRPRSVALSFARPARYPNLGNRHIANTK